MQGKGNPPYRHEIDGLRGVAILAVLLCHAKLPYFGGGFIGVDIFFVVSGYLITRLICSQLAANTFSLASFYERRARRLLPALFAVLAISTVVAWFVLAPSEFAEFGGHVAATSLFVANIVYWIQSGYFATKSEYLPLIHTWSLSIEEQYYLFFPILLAPLYRKWRHKVWIFLLIAAGASLALAQVLSRTTEHPDAAFYLLPTRAWELLAGALIALGERRLTDLKDRHPRLSSALAAFGLVLCLLAILAFVPETQHPSILTALPVLGACLVIGFGTMQTAVGRVLASAPLLALGLISYSVYLWHQPILAFTRIALARELTFAEASLALCSAVLVGAASWRWIEQPFRKPGRLRPASIAYMSAAGTLVTVAAGSVLIYTGGLPSRMDSQVTEVLRRIADGGKIRRSGIRADECHQATTSPEIDEFLRTWHCIPDAHPRVLVVGDSISADKAWVLREAGFNVGNLGGAGCPLVPTDDPQERCSRILLKARQLFRDGTVDGVVLTRNWAGAVSQDEIHDIARFWDEAGSRVAVFTGMPVFSDFKNRVVKHLREGIPLASITPDVDQIALHERSMLPLKELGFTIINSRKLLCGETSMACSAFSNGTPLVGDPVHLQPAGARIMAERVKQDPVWLDWYHRLDRHAQPTN